MYRETAGGGPVWKCKCGCRGIADTVPFCPHCYKEREMSEELETEVEAEVETDESAEAGESTEGE
jgi:hypothetical protein